MNAEQVVEKILTQAKAEADVILNEAREKAAAQKAQLDAELAEFDTKTEELAKAADDDKLRRMLAAARMQNAQKLLSAKGAILADVFVRAKKAVNQLPDEPYLSLMAALMKQAVETGDEEVVIGKNETRINEAFIKTINRELGTGFKGNLRLAAQRAGIAGGFILSRGKVRINASSDVLIERLRESMQIELANELFE